MKSGSSLGDVVSVSHDGGRRFRQELLKGTSICEGGESGGTDPWVSIGAEGSAYVSTQRFDGFTVSTSSDAGRTWHTSVASKTPLWISGFGSPVYFDDKDALFADPARPGHAMLAWSEYGVLQPGGTTAGNLTQSIDIVRTGDAAATWTTRRAVHRGIPVLYGESNPSFVALPKGGIALSYNYVNRKGYVGLGYSPGDIDVVRSYDGGATWSQPATAASVPPNHSGVYDPGTGACVRTGGDCGSSSFPGGAAAASGPDGSMYIVWHYDTSTTAGAIMLARSPDGGVHWSAPIAVVRSHTQVFLPEVAVMPDGTVGVAYDRFRPFHKGEKRLNTDVWLTLSRDGGRHFTERARLAGPFDFRAAPASSAENVGHFLGDYNGMAAFPDGFGVDYGASAPMARFGPSDIFFSRAVVGR